MSYLMKSKQAFYHTVHGPNHHWWALATTCLGSFMTTYDTGAVSISLPRVMTSFETSLTAVSWVLLAYLLTASALLLPAGRLGDIVGRKKIYQIGFIIFIIGSALCSLSQTHAQLIFFRILQAIGAAMIQTNSFAIVTAVFPERDRGKGLGFLSCVASIGITSGPAIGGLIVDTLGWRGIFFLNIPLGLTGAILAHLILQEKRVTKTTKKTFHHFDLAGACLAAVAICALLIGLSLGQEGHWLSLKTCFFMGTAALSMVVFPWFEARQINPLVDISLFKNRTFGLNNIARLICFLATSCNALLMPFFLQMVAGFSPFHAGLLIAPVSLFHAILSPIAGWLANYIRTQVLSSVGMAIMGLSLYSLSQLSLSSDYPSILGRLALLGLGYGIFQTPNNTSIMDSVDSGKFGITSGILAFVRQTGQALGVALASNVVVASMFSTVGKVSLYSLKRDRNLLEGKAALTAFADGIGTPS